MAVDNQGRPGDGAGVRRRFRFFAILLLFFPVFALPGLGLKERTPSGIDMSRLEDGVYRGESQHWPVAVEVEARVRDGRLTDIVILRHREGRGESAEGITGHIIAAQSLDVDVVSGATVSSRTIIEAVEAALRKSGPP
ncbi:MAG: FMN-binding protein [Spirochaetaceae bacterium]|jgi:uncharacterized protein with FMN-binding domain|nr:FMN-binding protein [Spirochaetaceae bacterium]